MIVELFLLLNGGYWFFSAGFYYCRGHNEPGWIAAALGAASLLTCLVHFRERSQSELDIEA